MRLVLVAFIFTALALLGCGDEKQAGRAYRDAVQRMASARTFLEDMAAQEGVERTRSGLLYRVERRAQGSAAGPALEDAVLIHYSAQLTDGNEIDSSYERNTPAEFSMLTLLAGLREGISLMRPGDRYVFYIPPQLAYGATGKAPIIPQNAALVYTVELLSVIKQQS
ncbi:MAG: FKBP-type peptidyl-prolyl cis-trans isomerase [Pseudomonadota bacterium]